MFKFDDASWHSEGDFPSELPPIAGGIHISLYLIWAVLSGLSSDNFLSEIEGGQEALSRRSLSPGWWFEVNCGGRFLSDMLNDDGLAFSWHYYANDSGYATTQPNYLEDYTLAFPGVPTLYHVPNAWASYDTIAPMLDQRVAEWRVSS